MRILVVEDDQVVGDAVRQVLARQGYAVDHVADAERAKSALHGESFDLAIVDIGLPRVDGLQLVRELRRQGTHLPILMLTARDALTDRVTALDLGADDYLTKPFEIAELVARCRALLRRACGLASPELIFGSLKLDTVHREVTANDTPLGLTQREWAILECLVLHAGHIVSKEKLMSSVTDWGDDITPNAIEVYISRLRGKLGSAATVRSVRGLGYRLDESVND